MATLFQERKLRELCHDPDTYAKAQKLLLVAKARTGPGSGYELGPHAPVLYAICAYLASTRLNNNHVKQKDAQIAACLRPVEFMKAVNLVESALGDQRQASLSYEVLFDKCGLKISHSVISVLRDIEDYLLESNECQEVGDSDLTGSVFLWGCKILKIHQPDMSEAIVNEFAISSVALKTVTGALDAESHRFLLPLKRAWDNSQNSNRSNSSSPSKSAPKLAPTESPMNTVLPTQASPWRKKVGYVTPAPTTNRPRDVEAFPKRRRIVASGSASVNDLQIVTSTRVTSGAPQSQKHATLVEQFASSPSISTRSLRKTAKSLSSGLSPDHRIADGMDVDQVSEFSDELLPSRRYHPVFLDHKQWYRRDPRLTRIWKSAEVHRDKMAKLYGHPFGQHSRQEFQVSV